MLKNTDYVHLHNHTEFSRFDGLAKIDDLTLTAKLLGMRALAISDHGNVGGWVKFHQSCKKKNKYKVPRDFPISQYSGNHFKVSEIKDKHDRIKELEITCNEPLKPIFGEEFYLARNHQIGGKDGNPDGRRGNRHLLLLAKNLDGYKNICALSQKSFIHGQYMDPRIDLNLLAEHSSGIICSSACLGSVINNNLLHGRYAQAKKSATILKDIFGDDFYLSAMYHGIDEEGVIIPEIIKLGLELDVPIVAENDCHYCRKDQGRSQELLMAMSSSRCIKDPKRIHFPYGEFYLKSAAEMSKIFGHYPEILSNTVMISEKVEDFLKTGGMRLPHFDIDQARKSIIINTETDHEKGKRYLDEIMSASNPSIEELDTDDATFKKAYAFMVELVEKGMIKLGWHNSTEHVEAIKKELKDVCVAWESNRMDFATYFLIVWDYINFARSKGILTGCGRGSGYASLILRTLGITYGPDPIKHGLLWERFLGFDSLYFLNDHDWGFGEIEDVSDISPEIAELSVDDLLDERAVEEDSGGVDRY